MKSAGPLGIHITVSTPIDEDNTENESITVRPYRRSASWHKIKTAFLDLLFYGQALLFAEGVEIVHWEGFNFSIERLHRFKNPKIEPVVPYDPTAHQDVTDDIIQL